MEKLRQITEKITLYIDNLRVKMNFMKGNKYFYFGFIVLTILLVIGLIWIWYKSSNNNETGDNSSNRKRPWRDDSGDDDDSDDGDDNDGGDYIDLKKLSDTSEVKLLYNDPRLIRLINDSISNQPSSVENILTEVVQQGRRQEIAENRRREVNNTNEMVTLTGSTRESLVGINWLLLGNIPNMYPFSLLDIMSISYYIEVAISSIYTLEFRRFIALNHLDYRVRRQILSMIYDIRIEKLEYIFFKLKLIENRGTWLFNVDAEIMQEFYKFLTSKNYQLSHFPTNYINGFISLFGTDKDDIKLGIVIVLYIKSAIRCNKTNKLQGLDRHLSSYNYTLKEEIKIKIYWFIFLNLRHLEEEISDNLLKILYDYTVTNQLGFNNNDCLKYTNWITLLNIEKFSLCIQAKIILFIKYSGSSTKIEDYYGLGLLDSAVKERILNFRQSVRFMFEYKDIFEYTNDWLRPVISIVEQNQENEQIIVNLDNNINYNEIESYFIDQQPFIDTFIVSLNLGDDLELEENIYAFINSLNIDTLYDFYLDNLDNELQETIIEFRNYLREDLNNLYDENNVINSEFEFVSIDQNQTKESYNDWISLLQIENLDSEVQVQIILFIEDYIIGITTFELFNLEFLDEELKERILNFIEGYADMKKEIDSVISENNNKLYVRRNTINLASVDKKIEHKRFILKLLDVINLGRIPNILNCTDHEINYMINYIDNSVREVKIIPFKTYRLENLTNNIKLQLLSLINILVDSYFLDSEATHIKERYQNWWKIAKIENLDSETQRQVILFISSYNNVGGVTFKSFGLENLDKKIKESILNFIKNYLTNSLIEENITNVEYYKDEEDEDEDKKGLSTKSLSSEPVIINRLTVSDISISNIYDSYGTKQNNQLVLEEKLLKEDMTEINNNNELGNENILENILGNMKNKELLFTEILEKEKDWKLGKVKGYDQKLINSLEKINLNQLNKDIKESVLKDIDLIDIFKEIFN